VTPGFGPLLAPTGGLRAEYDWPRVALVLEVVYSERGARRGESFADGSTTAGDWPRDDALSTYRLGYVDVPVLLKVALPSGEGGPPSPGGAGAYVVFGPSFGFSTGGRYYPPHWSRDARTIDDLRPIDLGITGGLGAAFPPGNGAVGFELRYTEGLKSPFIREWDSDDRNRSFSLRLFFLRS